MGPYLMALLLAAGGQAAPSQTPTPAPTPAPSPTPAQLAGPPKPADTIPMDLGTAIAGVVGRMLSVPRFEEHLEVRDRYQDALDAYLKSADIACGPRGGPDPTPYDDMNRVAGTSKPASADLLSGMKWLFHKGKKDGGDVNGRYYVYSVTMQSSPGRIVHVVRDGPISENSRSLVPGTSWQLVGRFADQSRAAEAISRLQHGESVQTQSHVLWAASRCLH